MTDCAQIKLQFDSSSQLRELEEEQIMGSQKISVSEHIAEKSDSFVVEMNGFDFAPIKDTSPSSRITRIYSPKGLLQVENQANDNMATHNKQESEAGSKTTEATTVTAEVSGYFQTHQQIPMEQQDNIRNTKAESRFKIPRKIGSRRHPSSFFWTPNRILLFFATLSSIGTILLIYFTLALATTREPTADTVLDWHQ